MNPRSGRSRRPWCSLIVRSLWLTPAAASPRSSVVVVPARASRSLTGRQNSAISLVSRNKMDPKKMEASSSVGACMLSESLYTSASLGSPAPIPQCNAQAASMLTCQPPSHPHQRSTLGVLHHERLGHARRLSLNLESYPAPIALTSLELCCQSQLALHAGCRNPHQVPGPSAATTSQLCISCSNEHTYEVSARQKHLQGR
jgi:hypothetical protein